MDKVKTIKVYENTWQKLYLLRIKQKKKSIADVIEELVKNESI